MVDNKLIYGETYSVPETHGAHVPDGFERFWYECEILINEKEDRWRYSYHAPIDCINDDVFQNWLFRVNDEHSKFRYRRYL